MAGKVIVLEGLDGSGKTTQLGLLHETLAARGVQTRRVKLPDYDSPACEPVKMYLGGAFGEKPGDVNAYTASALYAVDRFASWRTGWGEAYDAGNTILFDRYASSNLYHQATKLPRAQWDAFFAWCEDFEYDKIGLPRPDLVLYLDLPIALSQKLLRERYQGDETQRDIHERDLAYLEQCREAALYAAKKLGWALLPCCEGDRLRSIPEMQELIVEQVMQKL